MYIPDRHKIKYTRPISCSSSLIYRSYSYFYVEVYNKYHVECINILCYCRMIIRAAIVQQIFVVMDTTTLSKILEGKTLKTLKEEIFRNWQENGSKIFFGRHQLNFEIGDIDEIFIQKAKDELRETPEVIVESYIELRQLIAGKARSIV